MVHGTKNAKNIIITPAISYIFISEKAEKVSVHDRKNSDQAKIHPNIKFIIILVTNEKKSFSNTFIFIIFPLFVKYRFVEMIS